MMGSESCKRIWHPVWGSSPFCYHERLLKGWKSSLSPPQPLWQIFPSFSPHPTLVLAVLSPSKNWQGFLTSCWVFLQRNLLDLLKGSRTPRMEPMEGKSTPQKPGYPQFTESECNMEHGLQLSVCPQEWGKDISKRTRGDRRNWAGSATMTNAVSVWGPTCKDRKAGAEGMSDLKCFSIPLIPDSVALNSSHLQSF